MFAGNTAYESGGAIYIYNAERPPVAVTINGCELVGNNCGGSGGGIASDNADLVLTGDTDIHDNSAERGGGVFVSRGSIMFDGVSIGWNTASIAGDGVYLRQAAMFFGPGDVTWYGNPPNSMYVEPS
ncbi:MAG: hypothetical protein L0241_10875 [Planctomycetia bacterium]|nr:hypothetical protein [Planctomycetia bacterium]